jgi:hypothetical protein
MATAPKFRIDVDIHNLLMDSSRGPVRPTILHSEECRTENQCARRSTSEKRAYTAHPNGRSSLVGASDTALRLRGAE